MSDRSRALSILLFSVACVAAVPLAVLYVGYTHHRDDVVCKLAGRVVVVKPGVDVKVAMERCGR